MILTYDCSLCSQSFKQTNCLSNGKFCPYVPSKTATYLQDVSPKDLLEESVRQKCIYIHLKEDFGEPDYRFYEWFEYAKGFHETCAPNNGYHNRTCSDNLMKINNIDKQKVDACLEQSFENGDRDKINTILEDDRQLALEMGVVMHPAITINNMTYRGDLFGEDIFNAICEGFKDRPDICVGDKVYEQIA